MKKTLLSMLAGLIVIGSASAVPSVESRRALCETQPDKFVWVENTEACVPINPCESESYLLRVYCNPIFDKVTTHDSFHKGLVGLYADTKGLQCEPVDSNLPEPYVMCKGKDYRVFKFAAINAKESNYDDTAYTVATALCEAASGHMAERGPHCKVDRQTCEKIADVIYKYPRTDIKGAWYAALNEACVIELNVSPTVITIKVPSDAHHYTTLGELDPNYDSEGSHFYGE